jgi:hypothetical protein
MISDGGLIQRQKDIIGLQDEMIVEIGQGVDRIHNQVKQFFIMIKTAKVSSCYSVIV